VRSFWRLVLCSLFFAPAPLRADDALPSWNDISAKRTIVAFVAKVAALGAPDYVKPEERKHPDWRNKRPFKAALAGDAKALSASGEKGVAQIIAATHAGDTPEAFQGIVAQWVATAGHPKFKAHFDRLTYQPRLELLAYLRANGSSIVTRFEVVDGKPVLKRKAKTDLVDEKAAQPVAIIAHIGRRPIAAFGNLDGHFEMVEWTTEGPGPRFGFIVHRDEDVRGRI
jgi:hypothetical protein